MQRKHALFPDAITVVVAVMRPDFYIHRKKLITGSLLIAVVKARNSLMDSRRKSKMKTNLCFVFGGHEVC